MTTLDPQPEILSFEIGGENESRVSSLPQHPQVMELPTDAAPPLRGGAVPSLASVQDHQIVTMDLSPGSLSLERPAAVPPEEEDHTASPEMGATEATEAATELPGAASAAPVPVPEEQAPPASMPVQEEEPAPPAPAAAATAPPVSQFRFHAWFHTLFQVLLDFSIMSCSTLDGTSTKASSKLRETIQRMRMLNDNMHIQAPPPAQKVTDVITQARQTLPASISDMLGHIFKKVADVHRAFLDKELEWTREWTTLHVGVLRTYVRISVQLHQRWRQNLEEAQAAARKWEGNIDSLIRPEQTKLRGKFMDQARQWLQFCQKYTQALSDQGLDAQDLYAEQQTLLEVPPDSDEIGWGTKPPLSFAIQMFIDQCNEENVQARPAPDVARARRTQEKLEEQGRRLQQLRALEEDMLQNRRRKHELWLAMQKDQISSSSIAQIQELDDTYGTQQQEVCLISNLIQEDHAAASQQGLDADADADAPGCPPPTASPERLDVWRACAARFLPMAHKLEKRMIEIETMPKKLRRIIYATHDEYIKNALGTICSKLHKLRAKELQTLHANLALKSAQLKTTREKSVNEINVLLKEASEHCRAHVTAYEALSSLHASIRAQQEADAKYRARLFSLEQMQAFIQNNADLQVLLRKNRMASEENANGPGAAR